MVKLCLTQQQTNEIVKLCELTYNNKNYVQFLDNIIKLGIETFKTPIKEPEIIIKYVERENNPKVDETIYKLLNNFNDNELNFNKVDKVIDDVKVNNIKQTKQTKQLVKKKPKNKPKIKDKVCEYCNKICSSSEYSRYHGEKCKFILNKEIKVVV